MADITQTAANVLAGTGARKVTGVSGGTIVAGNSVYLDTVAGTYKLADAGGASAAIAVAGVALTNSSAGQPIVVQTEGQVNLGATLTAGQVYIVSGAAPGGIAPVSDMTAGDRVGILGIAISTSLLEIGLQHTTVQFAG